MTSLPVLDIQAIMRMLPHRYPFLLIDRVTELVPGQRVVGYKNVTINEPFFNGHFPTKPVMPGVLMIEALAQAACILAKSSLGEEFANTSVMYLAGVDDTRFKRVVTAGDRLTLTAEMGAVKRGIGKFQCRGEVDGVLAVEANLIAALRPE